MRPKSSLFLIFQSNFPNFSKVLTVMTIAKQTYRHEHFMQGVIPYHKLGPRSYHIVIVGIVLDLYGFKCLKISTKFPPNSIVPWKGRPHVLWLLFVVILLCHKSLCQPLVFRMNADVPLQLIYLLWFLHLTDGPPKLKNESCKAGNWEASVGQHRAQGTFQVKNTIFFWTKMKKIKRN